MLRTLTVNTPATSRSLITIAAAKTELGLSGSSEDAWLTSAVAQVSAAIGTFCGRPEGFGRETVTETWRASFVGEMADSLVLSRDLAQSITSVTEDGTGLANTDFILDGPLLRRLRSDAPARWRSTKIVVVYAAGYTLPAEGEAGNVPQELGRCCLDMVVRAYQGRGRDPGLRSERILDVIAQSWDTPGGDGFMDGLPRDVAERLLPYARDMLA